MELIKSIKEVDRPFGVTIGNFDGVHLGHRAMLGEIKEDCKNLGLELVVITFNPHPIQILRPRENFLINSYDERRQLIEDEGVQYFLEINFTRDFSTLGPEEFLNDYIQSENLKKIFLGYDFAFGANKQGDAGFVEKYSKDRNLDFKILDEFVASEKGVSSSKVREQLKSGNVEVARKLLGRDFYVSGRIVKGEGRGKIIGFPTANISYDEARIIPQRGVYATRTIYRDQTYFSVTNVGLNPTFCERDSLSVETHLLDFENDIYGEFIKVEFVKRIRDEKKFSSVNELVGQIKKDAVESRKILS